MIWNGVGHTIWQGRDDLAENPLGLRLFQSITQAPKFSPELYPNKIGLLGFECDEGVRLNKGRTGSANAPDAIRKAMANLAVHKGINQLVDLGNISINLAKKDPLSNAQRNLSEYIHACHQHNLRTLVLGGGHETAFGHGLGIYKAYPDKKIGIINFDAHLDLRDAKQANSGTPFKQLADFCKEEQRDFNYMCIGASLAANTQALIKTADDLDVSIIWDTQCNFSKLDTLHQQIQEFIDSVDVVYLTIDLDVLAPSSMFAVSAPAAFGMDLSLLLELSQRIVQSNKLKSIDLVEYNPLFDQHHLCAKVAARIAWQLCLDW